MYFDEDMRTEIQEVLDTSALLEITEFEVFRIAYAGWFGKPASDPVIEPFFTDYMFHDAVPIWVRHFTRRVLSLSREGRLEPGELGIPASEHHPRATGKGIRYLLVAVIWVTVLVGLAHFATRMWPENHCFFPPCY